MDRNPYTPPQAETEISLSPKVAPRPIAVWLLIAMLLAVVLLFIVGIVQIVWVVMGNWSDVRSAGSLVVPLMWRLAVLAILLAAAFSAYARHRWSRWFGVALIVAFASFSIFRHDTTYYANSAARAGGHIGRFVFIPLIFAWWAYALAF